MVTEAHNENSIVPYDNGILARVENEDGTFNLECLSKEELEECLEL